MSRIQHQHQSSQSSFHQPPAQHGRISSHVPQISISNVDALPRSSIARKSPPRSGAPFYAPAPSSSSSPSHRSTGSYSSAHQSAPLSNKSVNSLHSTSSNGSITDSPVKQKPANVPQLKLDVLRAANSGLRIMTRDTKECFYSMTHESRICSPTTTGLHRGSVLDFSTPKAGSKPFATFVGKSIVMRQGSAQLAPSKGSKSVTVKRREFLYSNGLFGQVNRFKVKDVEYKLHRPLGSSDLNLIRADDETKTPLCRFVTNENTDELSSGSIEIYACAISSDLDPRPQALTLVHNGRPTMLLDMAIIAEKVFRGKAGGDDASQGYGEEDDYSSEN